MKIFFLSLLILLTIFLPLSGSFLDAQDTQRRLEVDYPQIGDIRPIYAEGEGLPDYIVYMVGLLIVLAVLVAIISLIKGGISWLTARGDPAKIKEGKERIGGAVFGLIIILSSSLFLSSINPTLIELEELEVVETEEDPFPPGIYLSPDEYIPEDIEEMGGDTYRVSQPVRNFEDTIVRSIRISNQLDQEGNVLGYYYAAVVHEQSAFRGRCAVFINNTSLPKDFSIPGDISSLSVIRVSAEPLGIGRIRAYMRPDFNENYPSESLQLHTEKLLPLSIREVWSIDIEGNYAVILASGDSWETTEDGCGVLLDSKPMSDLKEHHMNKCNPRKMMPFFAAYESCATHYMVLPLFR